MIGDVTRDPEYEDRLGRRGESERLVKDVVDRVSRSGACVAYLTQVIRGTLIEHQCNVRQHGEDMPQVRDWIWGAGITGKTGPARQ